MKKFLKPMFLPYFTMIFGVWGSVCMYWVYATGVDQRMLLDPFHPGAILTWFFTAVMLATAILLTRPLKGKMRYERLFPHSIAGTVGTALSALAIAVTAWGELNAKGDRIITLAGWLGMLGAVCLLYLAWCRYYERRPFFGPRCVVLTYLMLHMLCRYRVWSSEPELLRLFFDLGATVCFVLATYQRLAIETGMAQRRGYVCFSMLGAYFTMAALPGSSDRMFLVGMAVWAMTDLCNLRVFKLRKQEDA